MKDAFLRASGNLCFKNFRENFHRLLLYGYFIKNSSGLDLAFEIRKLKNSVRSINPKQVVLTIMQVSNKKTN